jgi:hypothetical protein
MLHLNMAHRFYADIYDGDLATPELRAALEVLLFSMGDVILDEEVQARATSVAQIESWSRRLDLALDMLASHMRSVNDAETEDGWFDLHAG